ncbi:MAG: hypothetical protein P4L84_35480 [Isosphaeraceae bacterium]|nr:hypothetical protein [Isosphaeraceae bacterium]
MKTALFRTVGLVVLAAGTSWVVSTIVGTPHVTPIAHAAPVVKAITGRAKTTVNGKVDRQLAVAPSGPAVTVFSENVVADFQMDAFNVETNGRNVAVSAQASLVDKRRQTTHVWTLVARDRTTNEAVHTNVYREAAMTAAPGDVGRPTFLDVLALPPGGYTIELRLHQIPDNFKFARMEIVNAEANDRGKPGPGGDVVLLVAKRSVTVSE